MEVEQQRSRAGDVRRRHRRAGNRLVVVAGWAEFWRVRGRRHAGENLDAGGRDVRLEEVTTGSARGEGGHDVALAEDLGALCERRGRAGVGGEEREQGRTGGRIEVDRR